MLNNKEVFCIRIARMAQRAIVLVFVLVAMATFSTAARAWNPKCPTSDNTCYWSGTAPLCNSKCPSGYGPTGTPTSAAVDGLQQCTTGKHALCCPSGPPPSSCFWHHTAPICSNSDCPAGSVRTGEPSDCGDGKCCATGKKILCCR